MSSHNQTISDVVSRESTGLRNFIRRRVADATEVEDILQDVWFEFVEAYRLPQSIEHIGAWLYQVARHRIIDRFRKKREVALPENSDDDDDLWLGELLAPASDAPDAVYERSMLMTAVAVALEELPKTQRDVFVAHEVDGQSFKALSEAWGVSVNTLLARKRYAVLHLRSRLQSLYDDQ